MNPNWDSQSDGAAKGTDVEHREAAEQVFLGEVRPVQRIEHEGAADIWPADFLIGRLLGCPASDRATDQPLASHLASPASDSAPTQSTSRAQRPSPRTRPAQPTRTAAGCRRRSSIRVRNARLVIAGSCQCSRARTVVRTHAGARRHREAALDAAADSTRAPAPRVVSARSELSIGA